MRIIFLALRSNHYRHLLPIVEEALKRAQVECWHDNRPALLGGSKAYLYPRPENAYPKRAKNRPEIRSFKSDQELVELCQGTSSEDQIISLAFPSAILPKGSPSPKCGWNLVMNGIDTLYELGRLAGESTEYDLKRVRLWIYTEYWREWARDFFTRFHSENLGALLPRLEAAGAIGNTEMDSFAGIDPDQVREKYSIPQGKKVVLYLPYAYLGRNRDIGWEEAYSGLWGVPMTKHSPLVPIKQKLRSLAKIARDPSAIRDLALGETEVTVFKALKRFCQRENAYLISKPRPKYLVAEPILKLSDRVVHDQEQDNDPPFMKELLTVSSLCVSTFSTSVLTAAYAGVHHLNLRVPDKIFIYDTESYWFTDPKRGFFESPGVATNLSPGTAARLLKRGGFSDFPIHEQACREYTDKFLGPHDQRSSARLLDQLLSF